MSFNQSVAGIDMCLTDHLPCHLVPCQEQAHHLLSYQYGIFGKMDRLVLETVDLE